MKSSVSAPRVVLLDIEGTTAPVSFVHQILFPYARGCLKDYLDEHADDAAVQKIVADVRKIAPDKSPAEQLISWIDEDAKVAPLKELQGLIWARGYQQGELTARLYPDVAPVLQKWSENGLTLAVYSSGSEAAQRLIYGHTEQGDLTPLFSHFFDLRVGGKKEADSYRAIVKEAGWQAADVLFLSDVTAELDAAAEAGLKVCQVVRPEDGTVAGTSHPVAASLPEAARHFALPGQEGA
ncbi:acireductone synthase [Acetobacter thailandicus]|uniref:Enolase-phosphatase E1 n=1 Tax=Acetobacter thailandicus TaxID=1502842 RepID=A0ABT3QER0_9PROT|nr:acireductone synthase [Acetobacter thailandicus]MBS0985744.1 acireductone synthase [Acetobacter thailandicus]MBS1002368.1 acireductone synthase [Acetobacter thailandicus]MCX2563778.1 acireductone synthase [Acetobacter thailandicus]NHN95147.1 acireductone synthase [Acetobacter thailandicus]